MSESVEHEINLLSEALLRFRAVVDRKAKIRDFQATDEMCAWRLQILYFALKNLVDIAELCVFQNDGLSAKISEAKKAVTDVEQSLNRKLSYPGEEE